MRKTRTFNLVIDHLAQQSAAALRDLLPKHSQPVEPATRAQQLQHAGWLAVLLQEACEHRLNLFYLDQACHHGLLGTQPSDYDDDQPYDPYAAMQAYLAGHDDTVPCLMLSEDLQAYIAALPPVACQQGLGTGTTCSLPTHAFGELACGRAQLHQLAYYEQDLRQLHTLVQQRAELHRIQELL